MAQRREAGTRIRREHILLEPDSLSDHGQVRIVHYCWPSEFPLAVCGQVLERALPVEPRELVCRAELCGSCQTLLDDGLQMTRVNPHAA